MLLSLPHSQRPLLLEERIRILRAGLRGAHLRAVG